MRADLNHRRCEANGPQCDPQSAPFTEGRTEQPECVKAAAWLSDGFAVLIRHPYGGIVRSILTTIIVAGALALPVATQAQTRVITGTVTISGTGQQLADATISIVGGTAITRSAANG